MSLRVDPRLLFSYDQGLLDEETDRWKGEPVADPPLDASDSTICACRKHPSGRISSPRQSCMSCHGTGVANTESSEVYDVVFDGKGNFTQREGTQQADPGDSATMVKFR